MRAPHLADIRSASRHPNQNKPQLLARTATALRDAKAPPPAVDAALGVLRHALEAAVRRLADHLEALPARLVARETWAVSLTHSHTGEAPVTHLPERLQEEVTAAVRFYEALATTAGSALGGRPPADISARPLHLAFFACLGGTTAALAALAERFSPPDAAGEGGDSGGGGSSGGNLPGARPLAAEAGDDDDGGGSGGGSDGGSSPLWRSPAARSPTPLYAGGDGGDGGVGDDDGDGTAIGAAAEREGGVGVGGVPGVSDDVRLLLTASNLAHVRTRLMGSLTQRFLLALTGEQAGEVARVGRTVRGLAKRMDAALRAMYGAYAARQRARLDRLLDAAVGAPGASAAGAPPELRDVTPGAQALLQALARAQAEAYTYAR